MSTEADLQAWTGASGRDWDQLCQAYVWNLCDVFGSAPVTYPDALAAYYATPIEGWDVNVPAGACAFFDIGAYGHVGWQVDTGDAMGSGRVSVFWGINAGVASITDYIARTGASFLGWGWTNGVNSLPYTPAGSIPPPDDESEDDMPNGYYAKGDRAADVYWIDQATGKRRPVPKGELTAAQSYNNATGGKTGAGYVATMSQADFDAIPVQADQ